MARVNWTRACEEGGLATPFFEEALATHWRGLFTRSCSEAPKTVATDDHRIDRQTIPASDRCYPARSGRMLESLRITGAIARRISSGT
jgi:hypothetical protein